jgi:hypothetical protein
MREKGARIRNRFTDALETAEVDAALDAHAKSATWYGGVAASGRLVGLALLLRNENGDYAADYSCEHFSADLRDADVFPVEPSRDLGLRVVDVTVTITRGAP